MFRLNYSSATIENIEEGVRRFGRSLDRNALICERKIIMEDKKIIFSRRATVGKSYTWKLFGSNKKLG